MSKGIDKLRSEMEGHKLEGLQEKRLKRMKKLPPPLRTAGYFLMERLEDGSAPENQWEQWELLEENKEKALKMVEKMSDLERATLFDVLFGQMGPHVCTFFAWSIAMPYEIGGMRKAFHSEDPEDTGQVRGQMLDTLLTNLDEYDMDLPWVARWAPLLDEWGVQSWGPLFAAVIDAGGADGEALFSSFIDTVHNENSSVFMGAHIITALLSCSRPRGWEVIADLLRAAQRQEGLRQSIMEAVDMAHPEAFRLFMRMLLDENLIRFSSVIRSVMVWFGFGEEEEINKRQLKAYVEMALGTLEDAALRRACLEKGTPQQLYFALWSEAHIDVQSAVGSVKRILGDDRDPDRRFAAFYLYGLLQRRDPQVMLSALKDETQIVAAVATALLDNWKEGEERDLYLPTLFDLLDRFPQKEVELETPVWSWVRIPASKNRVLTTLITLLDDDIARLYPHLPLMDADNRSAVVRAIASMERLDEKTREVVFSMAGDASGWVRSGIFDLIEKLKPTKEELRGFEALLARSSKELRNMLFDHLIAETDEEVMSTSERLLASRNKNQRLGGIELLRRLHDQKRMEDRVGTMLRQQLEGDRKLSAEEVTAIHNCLETQSLSEYSLRDCLGLIDPARVTRFEPPRKVRFPYKVGHVASLILELETFIEKHEEDTFTYHADDEDGHEARVVGEMEYYFPGPSHVEGRRFEAQIEGRFIDAMLKWYDSCDLFQNGGLDLFLVKAALEADWESIEERLVKKLRKEMSPFTDKVPARYETQVSGMVDWLLVLRPPEEAFGFLVTAMEHFLAEIPLRYFNEKIRDEWDEEVDIRSSDTIYTQFSDITGWYARLFPGRLGGEELAQYIRLKLWQGMETEALERLTYDLEFMMAAYEGGFITLEDLGVYIVHVEGYTLKELFGAKPHPLLEQHPEVLALLDRIRSRILEIELVRGEQETIVSNLAMGVQYWGGSDVMVRTLKAMGNLPFKRGYVWGTPDRHLVFSHIILGTYPGPSETVAHFREAIGQHGITDTRLIELSVFAPQWAFLCQEVLGWPMFGEAVWWLHAHTKDDSWSVPEEVQQQWESQISRLTPLSAEDLTDGAVDVEWYERIGAKLSKVRWESISAFAKYASEGAGHRRAQIFADALNGALKITEILAGIERSRRKEYVIALGLVKLPRGKAREKQLAKRYGILQDFLATSKQFGSARQTSEKRVVEIAMHNLARTAGYEDSVRFIWAMETQEVLALTGESSRFEKDQVAITMEISPLGEPELVITKSQKLLKSIPAALKKEPRVKQFAEHKAELRKQMGRIRESLESSMCVGSLFTGEELVTYMRHPILRSYLERLVLTDGARFGYMAEEGTSLLDCDGTGHPLEPDTKVRIAHSWDLLKTGRWHEWQRECFEARRAQPFKQVFRELYPITEREKKSTESLRYEAHQVNPRQALALLGQRGWKYDSDAGMACRTNHLLGYTAWLGFEEYFYTPAEIEGLTIAGVHFTRRASWERLALPDIPPVWFSEVMRDVDLIVSVAHMGGVDPETSSSTVEMRAVLAAELATLLGLGNVTIKDRRAFIKGSITDYTVHLGSGVVHTMPGGAICIIPVHSQHRGRLFLPFVDSDPKTAEVLSKILLLSEDTKIKDPTILQQLR